MSWKTVSREEAEAHELYGFKGWLLLFWVIALIGIVQNAATFFMPDVESQYRQMGIEPSVVYAGMVLGIIGYLPLIVLAPMKHPSMPKIVQISLVATFVIGAGINLTQLPIAVAASGLAFGAVFLTLVILYFRKSKRVNVTYLHRVPE